MSSSHAVSRAEERPLIASSCHARDGASDSEDEEERLDVRSVHTVASGGNIRNVVKRLAVSGLAFSVVLVTIRLALPNVSAFRGGPASSRLRDKVQLFTVMRQEDGRNFTLDCGTAFTLDNVTHSNLGGWGPHTGEEGIVYQISETKDNSVQRSLQLEVNAISRYKPARETLNGKVGEVGVVSLQVKSMVELKFSIKDEHGLPIKVPYFPITFYDAEERNPSLTQDFVIARGNFSQVAREPKQREMRSMVEGFDVPRPAFPRFVAEILDEWSVAVTYRDVDHFKITLGTTGDSFPCFPIFTLTNAPQCMLVDLDGQASSDVVAMVLGALGALLLLALLLYGLARCCRRRSPEEMRQIAAAQAKADGEAMAKRAFELLSAPKVDYEAPELVRIISVLKSHKSYVKALCGAPWNDWSAPGECQVCKISVDRKEKGLHCANGGHRICWKCMCKEMDWDRLAADQVRAAQEAAKRDGYFSS